MFFNSAKSQKIKEFYKPFEEPLKKILKPDTHYQAVLHTEKGDVTLELFVEDAPNHVALFVSLVRKKEYENARFYRVVKSFVTQTGPTKGETHILPIKAEINHHDHLQGMVSMAHGKNIDSAKGSFFICLGAIPSLNGEFTVFGKVLSGLDILQSLTVGSILAEDLEYYKADFQGDILKSVSILESSDFPEKK